MRCRRGDSTHFVCFLLASFYGSYPETIAVQKKITEHYTMPELWLDKTFYRMRQWLLEIKLPELKCWKKSKCCKTCKYAAGRSGRCKSCCDKSCGGAASRAGGKAIKAGMVKALAGGITAAVIGSVYLLEQSIKATSGR